MAKKDFGRRLMPEYLLNYSEELHKNHPDPSASWGGGSGDYTAGEGIDITGDVISIDEEVVAKKTDIPTVPSVLSAFTNDVGYITGITRTDVTTALGYVPGTSNFSGSYNDLSDKPTIPTVNDPTIQFIQGNVLKGTIHLNQSNNQTIVFDAGSSGSDAANVTKVTLTVTYYDGDWTITPPVEDMDSVLQMLTFVEVQEVISGQTTTVHELTNISLEELSYNIRKFKFIEDTPLANYIERRTIYLTVNWTVTPTTYTWSDYSVVQVNYPTVTSLPWSSITDKPTFATVATSGSYNDLSDKPTIPDTTNFVTTNTNQTITGYKTFTDSIVLAEIFEGGHNLVISNTIGLIGFSYNSRDFELPISKPSSSGTGIPYTLATTDDIPSLSGYATETWVGQQGFLTGITSAMISSALGYTPGTSNFSGSYTDLTDKPSIPTVNDATITFTQGGTTKGTITLNQSTNQTIALDAGGGSSAPYEITNMVVDSTNQTITLTITANE